MLSLVAMDFFQRSPLLVFPLFALGVFMLVFVFVTLRTVLSQSAHYDAIARLPLEPPAHPQTQEVFRE